MEDPKPKKKPVERNDYDVCVVLLEGKDVDLVYKGRTKGEAIAAMERLSEGFVTERDGFLIKITKYNIHRILASKKEKDENKQLQGEGAQAPADGSGPTA